MGDQKSSETEKTPPSVTTIVCPHCNTGFDLQGVAEIDCSDCGVTTLTILTKRCKDEDCVNAYCRDCQESNLSEHGFCGECETLSCDGCGDDIARGTEVSCTHCKKSDFCETCAPEMVAGEVGCVDCVSDDLKIECADSNCSKTLLKAKARLCKNFDSCDTAFCPEHAKDDLDEQGYCEDCNSFDCSHCGDSFDIDKGARCANPGCSEKAIFCQKCCVTCLDTTKLCANCTLQPTIVCADCQNKTIAKQTTSCENCQSPICGICTDNFVHCSVCQKKLCGNCKHRLQHRGKWFCSSCNPTASVKPSETKEKKPGFFETIFKEFS